MKRLFGTDGIRGVAGEFPLDAGTVERIGRALAVSLAAAAGRPPRVVLGRDTRESGPPIEEAFVRGVAAEGGRADRAGILTTPAIACVARLLGYDAGVVISASHNPYRDNGIKIFSGHGQKLPDRLEAAIERRVLDGEDAAGDDLPMEAWRPASGGGAGPPAARPEDLRRRYDAWLGEAVGAHASLRGVRIVLDCANGAASSLAPEVFGRLGAEVTALSASPDGRNINEDCGALHPQRLAAEVVRLGARLGLAFDGDADRCVAVDASGRVLDGDYILYLLARDLNGAGRLEGGLVVGTVMSNLWLERALHAEGIRLLRAQVGDKYVLEEMQRGGIALGGDDQPVPPGAPECPGPLQARPRVASADRPGDPRGGAAARRPRTAPRAILGNRAEGAHHGRGGVAFRGRGVRLAAEDAHPGGDRLGAARHSGGSSCRIR